MALLYIVDGINPPRRKSVTTDVPITKSEKTARKSAEKIRRRYEEELNNNLKVTQMAQSSNNSILFCDYMLNWLKMMLRLPVGFLPTYQIRIVVSMKTFFQPIAILVGCIWSGILVLLSWIKFCKCDFK